ncbi:Transcriptional regulator, TetR family [Maridesulfovibrio hydrothermalis AM13 = DSM 14728]|uniref:Transcriptional regulator, TetR family n=1 Tax=Maridesulfovibrio hydrothermalis AM13 = DSM 14728 TaxID=1121451 RepID=L0RA05_9BACT|nr:Transcriptional regulator, TetR family [Maridesulfovibrio hydrothermalis AM13 = DSM 14728]
MILEAAKELFAKDGFDNVSVRKIAAKINYSPAALYRYFKNKEDLILSLKKAGEERFRLMQAHLADIEDPFERLREGGRIYLDYARKEPEYYELLFNRRAPSFCDQEKWIGKPHQSFINFRETVRQCLDTGVLGDVPVDIAVASLWSSVHGLAALASTGRLESCLPDFDLDTAFDKVLDFTTIPQKERGRREKADEDEKEL